MAITYFISDVHLSLDDHPDNRSREKKFLRFLEQIESDAGRIFFVGDLFDFWFEYKYAIPKHQFEVLYRLKHLAGKNIEMHYLTGNHDFWLGRFFTDYIGIKTWDNDWSGEIDGKKFYLFHGDGVAHKDVGYRVLKRILRNKINIRIFRWLHPDAGIPFARFVSGSSRHYTNNINLNANPDYIEFAEKKFSEGFDFVLMGHRHTPLEHTKGKNKYINIGDWLYNFSYAVFDGKNLRLEKFIE